MTTVLSLYTFQDAGDATTPDAVWTANSTAWTAYALAANVPGPIPGTTGFQLIASTSGASKGGPVINTTADFQAWVTRTASYQASNEGSSLTDTTTASTSGSDPTTTTPPQTAPAPATASSNAGPIVAVAGGLGLAALVWWLL